jgi:CheY-like chemotaxis protein
MPSILIIEDDPKFRAILRKQLEPLGFLVHEADDGEEGLASVLEHRPKIVLTDLLMPNKEGIETIRDIRAAGQSVFIVAMSGGGKAHAADFLTVAKSLGADAVIAKPFSLQELLALIAPLKAAAKTGVAPPPG